MLTVMDPAKMSELLTLLTREEIRDGLWLVGVFERWGQHVARRGRRVDAPY